MERKYLNSEDIEKCFSVMKDISQLVRIINGYFKLDLDSFARQSLKSLDYEIQKLLKLTDGCLNFSYKIVDIYSGRGKKKTKEIWLYIV